MENIKIFFLSLGKKLNKLDKAFYFPVGLAMITPLLLFFFGWIVTYLSIMVLSYAHFVYLFWNPYVKDSDFYRYRVFSEEFFAKNNRFKPLLEKKQLAQLHLFMWLCLYCFFTMPTFVMELAPIYILALVVSMSQQTIEILNIVHRPQLPKEICSYHFLLQRRHSPTAEFIAHKVVPLCQNALSASVKVYSGVAFGWKGYYGALEIDPIRNFGCNLAHGFPTSHQWNETSLSTWSALQRLDSVKSHPHSEVVKAFLKGERHFTQHLDDMASGLIKYTKPS